MWGEVPVTFLCWWVSPGSFSDGCHPDSHMPSGPSPPSLAVPCVPCPTPRWWQHATTLHTPQMPCLCHKLLSSSLEGPGPPCHPVLQDLFVVSAPKGRDFFHCFHTPSPPAGLWDTVKTLGHSTRDWLLRPIKAKEHWLAGSRAPSTELAPGSLQGSGRWEPNEHSSPFNLNCMLRREAPPSPSWEGAQECELTGGWGVRDGLWASPSPEGSALECWATERWFTPLPSSAEDTPTECCTSVAGACDPAIHPVSPSF